MTATTTWIPLGGWHAHEPGLIRRVYKAATPRACSARRAEIRLTPDGWAWQVVQFDLRTRDVRLVVARGPEAHTVPEAAFGPADEAARANHPEKPEARHVG